MMGWLDDLFLNKGVSKEAEQTNRDTEWDKKLKTSSWLSETLKESDDLEKEATYVLGDDVSDTVKKDYELAVEGMSDSNIAEMLAEFNLVAEGMASDPLKATEEKEKQMKYVSGNRKAAEEKLLKAVGEHTLLDWKEKFKSFKEAKPIEVKKPEELHEPKFEPKKQNWEKTEDFEAPSDKEKTKDMVGIGKEEEKGQVGKEAVLQVKANPVLPPVESVSSAEEARQIAIDWQAGQSELSPSYGEMAEWGHYFEQLATKFPEVAEEFSENGITAEIKSKASKEEIVALFKTAEIASPWGVVKDEQGNDAIAKLTPEKTTKESDKDDQDDLVK